MVVRFGQVELDLQAFELRREGRPVHVEPQVFEVVRYLVTHRDRLVPKEELLEQVWGTRFVSSRPSRRASRRRGACSATTAASRASSGPSTAAAIASSPLS